jgi:hypothetical protein
MRTAVAISVLALLVLTGAVPAGAGSLWTLVVVGGAELAVSANDEVGGLPTINLEPIASRLALAVDRRPGDVIALRDTAGAEWRTANGSALLEGAAGTRALSVPAVVTAGAVYLPLNSAIASSGR